MFDLAVIGGGAGALDVALAASRLGASVALIGPPRPLSRLCWRRLRRAAGLVHDLRNAARWGIAAEPPRVDFPALVAYARSEGGREARTAEELASNGVEVIPGRAAFEAYDTVLVDGQRRVSARRFVIATGSRPTVPGIPGLREAGFLDEESVGNLGARPDSLVVLGSSSVGLQLAQLLAWLGSSVTVLERSDQIVPGEDPEAAGRLRAALEADGIAIRTGIHVAGVSVRDGRRVVTYRERTGTDPAEVSASELLLAMGRQPDLDNLGLEAIHIHPDPESGIEVDDFLQTRAPHVYAIGEAVDGNCSSAEVGREAAIVVENALLGTSRRVDRGGAPRVVATYPEVASVGMSESVALRSGGSARALTAELPDDGGFAKVAVGPGGRILGACLVAPDASLILTEYTLAVEHGWRLSDLASVARLHPTAAELVTRLVAQSGDLAPGGLLRGALRWFYGLGARARPNGSAAGASEPEVGETPHHGGH
jgi:pyruvate/2-oxoglutarate dehydrogenase complex dihydrolipoamide dehydrogenase (E3) component